MMADLISRAAAIAKVKEARKAARTLTGMDFVMMLEKQPAVDAVPVVHGHWKGITTSRFMGIDDYYEPIYHGGVIFKCSQCGMKSVKRNYCPNCGAKMTGERGESE